MSIELKGVVYCNGCGEFQFEITHSGVKVYQEINKRVRKKKGTITKAGKVMCVKCRPTSLRNPAWAR